jgi:Family of unknown function (DUF5819)
MAKDCYRSQRWRRTATNAVRLLALCWFLLHFGLTAAYVLPPNPTSNGWQPLLEATIGTYYSQNWQLFAPDPLAQNYALYIRPLTDTQAADIVSHGLPKDGWFDMTNPSLVQFQQNRFAAYDRLARLQINAILNWLSGGSNLAAWQRSCAQGDSKACAVYQNQLKVVRVDEGKLLIRVASAFCKDAPQSCYGATQVALRAHEELGVPWSKRYTAARPEAHDMDLGVYPIDWRMANAHIYTNGRPE